MSSYIPAVAWGMCPGGTTSQITSYAASWGLLGDAPQGLWVPDLATAGYSIPTHATWISMPNTARAFFNIIVLLYWSIKLAICQGGF